MASKNCRIFVLRFFIKEKDIYLVKPVLLIIKVYSIKIGIFVSFLFQIPERSD